MKTIRNPKAIHQKIVADTVEPHTCGGYKVTSGVSGNTYYVMPQGASGASCTCNWGKYRPRSGQFQSGCHHVQAVMEYIAKQENRHTSAWDSEEAAIRQHQPIRNIGDGVILTARKIYG